MKEPGRSPGWIGEAICKTLDKSGLTVKGLNPISSLSEEVEQGPLLFRGFKGQVCGRG